MQKHYFIRTLGCQMNHSDSERFASVLENCGFKSTFSLDEADVIIINSCSVRQQAEDRVIGMGRKVNELKSNKPELQVVLTGCMTKRLKLYETDKETRATKEKKEMDQLLISFPWVDHIVNIDDLTGLPEKLGEVSDKPLLNEYLTVEPKYQSDFQAFVPISTGCNKMCTFCIVPYTRGRERSRPFDEVVSEVRNLIENGYKEITLLGQNVNSYGKDLGGKDLFPRLIKTIDEIEGDYWLKFTSSHPYDISPELIDVMANGKHFGMTLHFAMQAGSNEMLKRMNRHYTIEKFLELTDEIQDRIPEMALTTDVIVGFPGETQKEFEETKKAMEHAKFTMAYISEFSARKGTKAFEMEDDVSHQNKANRKFELNEVLSKSSHQFNKKFANKTTIVLVTKVSDKGTHTHNSQGLHVLVPEKREELIGQFADVKITDVGVWSMKGTFVT